ncbi:hypothetical protein AAFF_G00370890 [Aldrovandia affinis]|uniref:Uncharacterized protein n=1 Tax=Aldrovandia affinis TaxID=143900 RepID=A0AAD7WN68_9TELE|nr:hypothetical protein AAFF_G00370890 [Aldrovandia affinis]
METGGCIVSHRQQGFLSLSGCYSVPAPLERSASLPDDLPHEMDTRDSRCPSPRLRPKPQRKPSLAGQRRVIQMPAAIHDKK